MKNLSRIALSFLLLASFVAPLSVGALGVNCQPPLIYDSDTGTCVPSVLQSSGGINMGSIQGFKNSILYVINSVFVPVLFAVAFLVFLWGVFKYFIYGADSDAERKTGRQFVLWGIIGFVAILSVWGLVAVVASTFNLTSGGTPPNYPTL